MRFFLLLAIFLLLSACSHDGEVFHSVEIGDIMQFGGQYWSVMNIEDNHALLLRKFVMEGLSFHYDFVDVTWETSRAREWLNGEFFYEFSEAERARIRETTLLNFDNPWTFYMWDLHGNTPGGNTTTDKIFLLSIDDVLRYFGDSGMVLAGTDETARDWYGNLSTLEWSIGGWSIHDQYSAARVAYNIDGESSRWWLRSPGFDSRYAARILTEGILDLRGVSVNHEIVRHGFRPALWLNLEEGDKS